MSTRGRIWEVDAVRGFLILCVIVSHTLFYSSIMLDLFTIPPAVRYVMAYGGALFVILSGLSSTLGTHSFRRGVIVFAGGMILTLGSYIGVLMGWLEEDMIIRFGVLHLLGICMMLAPLLKKLPSWALLVLGAALVVVGYWLEGQPPLVNTRYLFPLGLRDPNSRWRRIWVGSAWASCWAACSTTRRRPTFPRCRRPIRLSAFSASAAEIPCISLSFTSRS